MRRVSTRSASGSELRLRSTRWTPPLFIGLGMAGSGVIGYMVASQTSEPNISEHSPEPVYGSPEDFAQAITELKHKFPSVGMVSTDGDTVHSHGTSTNDYHDGEWI